MKNFKSLLKKLSFTAILFIVIIIFCIKYSSLKYCYSKISSIPEMPICLILGAGVFNNTPSFILQDRLETAIDLYKNGKVEILLVSGDNGNDRDDEISVMKNYLVSKGIPEEKIISDGSGYNTYSSMYHAKNTFKINKMIIVTQKFHLARSLFIARKFGITCYAIAADKRKYEYMSYYKAREYLALIKAFKDILINAEPIKHEA